MGSPPNARTGSPASVTLLLEAAAGILYFTSVDQFLGCPDRAYGSGGLIEPFNEERLSPWVLRSSLMSLSMLRAWLFWPFSSSCFAL